MIIIKKNIPYLANFGGIYGLFLGMTFLSMLEILYYAIIRFSVNYRNVKLKQHTAKLLADRIVIVTTPWNSKDFMTPLNSKKKQLKVRYE